MENLASGVLLALTALVLKQGSERVSFPLQKGDPVGSLISDLTTKDSRARQDVALIALNYAVGNEDSMLVSEIAERIFFDLRNADTIAVTEQSS